jgi:hypothetical protein
MVSRLFRSLMLVAVTATLSGCAMVDPPEPVVLEEDEITARWDGLPEAEEWTEATLQALDGHGAALVETVPADISTYCPAYPEADETQRKAFWVNMLAALAKHESTYRPTASGGGGKWHGLLQISPGTARGYGCRAKSASDLKDGAANLSCAVRIMAVTVPRDGVISRNMRGIAADWGPFHQSRKRTDMQAWTSASPYCRKDT